MSKTCQYAMNDDKIFVGLTFVNVNMFKLVCKKKNLGEKIKEREVRMGKCMHWKWDVALKVKNFNQNNVWRNFGIQQAILLCYGR